MVYEIFENEVVMLLIGVGVLIFILGSRPRLKSLPASNILFASFYMLLVSWILTVLEGFFWEEILNYIEHACHAVSAVIVAVWCWKVFGRGRETGKEAL
ncbi:MAG: hypothetical protein WBC22_07270 [Sedimentisphaerales bacterium]